MEIQTTNRMLPEHYRNTCHPAMGSEGADCNKCVSMIAICQIDPPGLAGLGGG